MNLQGYEIHDQITHSQIDQIIQYSNSDPEIQKFTSDAKRFQNKASFDSWYAKGKFIYLLVDKNDNVFGLIWFSKKVLPSKKYTQNIDPSLYGITFAIRLYSQARGKGLSEAFFNQAFGRFTSSPSYQKIENKGLWLETSANNVPGTHLYQKLGFIKVTEPDENNKILMVKE